MAGREGIAGGVPLPGTRKRERALEIQLTGEPKSGTTWLEFMLMQLCREACAERLHHCTCSPRSMRQRKHSLASAKELGHSVLSGLGLERRAPNLKQSIYALQPHSPSHATTFFTQAVNSKHAIPALRSPLHVLMRSPGNWSSCFKQVNSSCLQRLGSREYLQTRVVSSSKEARQLLIVRDPRHAALSSCVFNVHLESYDSCIRRELTTVTRKVALRYAWHTEVLRDTSRIVLYDDLLHKFNESLRDICLFSGLPERVCSDQKLFANMSRDASKQKMARVERGEQGSKAALPGSNRIGPGAKVSSERVEDRVSMLTPEVARKAEGVLRSELPDELLKKLGVRR